VATRMTAGLAPGPMATTAAAVAADVVTAMGKGADVVWSPAPLKWIFAVLRLLPPALWRRMPADLRRAARASAAPGHDVEPDVVDDRFPEGIGHRLQEFGALPGGHRRHQCPQTDRLQVGAELGRSIGVGSGCVHTRRR